MRALARKHNVAGRRSAARCAQAIADRLAAIETGTEDVAAPAKQAAAAARARYIAAADAVSQAREQRGAAGSMPRSRPN